MRTVRILSVTAGPDGVEPVGSVCEVDDATAAEWVRQRVAEFVAIVRTGEPETGTFADSVEIERAVKPSATGRPRPIR